MEMGRLAEIEILQSDITTLKLDAIVNAANKSLLGGGGVDGAIHRAAGPDLLQECKTLNGCNTGDAKITHAYNLPCKKIIHTVGPIWSGGNENEEELLSSCYSNSFKLASEHNLRSIAFPGISTGAYGFPIEKASRIAYNTIQKHMAETNVEKVIFTCFDDFAFDIYKKVINNY